MQLTELERRTPPQRGSPCRRSPSEQSGCCEIDSRRETGVPRVCVCVGVNKRGGRKRERECTCERQCVCVEMLLDIHNWV